MQTNQKHPVLMFVLGVGCVVLFEALIYRFGIAYVQAYGLTVMMLGCSGWYGMSELAGNRRLHTPMGVTLGIIAILVAFTTTGLAGWRFISLLS